MVSKKQKERAEAQAFRAKLNTAMADFTQPTLEEMVKTGEELFKDRRSQKQVRRRTTGVPRLRARAGSKEIAKRVGTAAARDAGNASKSLRRKPKAYAAAATRGQPSGKGGPDAKQQVVALRQTTQVTNTPRT